MEMGGQNSIKAALTIDKCNKIHRTVGLLKTQQSKSHDIAVYIYSSRSGGSIKAILPKVSKASHNQLVHVGIYEYCRILSTNKTEH